MGKSGGETAKQQPTSQNITQTNLPEYARPYFEDVLTRTQQESINPYQPYTGSRIAETNADTNAGYNVVRGIDPSADMNAARGFLQGAGGLGQTVAGNYAPVTSQNWDANVMNQYMSPFQQGVTDVTKQHAVRDDNIARVQRNAAAVRAGAFGGSRQGVVEGMAGRDLGDRLSTIQAQGLQSAYANAQQQFGQDRSAGMAAQIENARNALTGGNLQMEAGRLFGATGQQDQTMALQRAQAMQQIGAAQQAQQQQSLDVGYSDFLNQRDYPRQQLNFYSGILRGVPVQASSDSTVYQQPPNPMNQMLGLGVAAAGAYGAMR